MLLSNLHVYILLFFFGAHKLKLAHNLRLIHKEQYHLYWIMRPDVSRLSQPEIMTQKRLIEQQCNQKCSQSLEEPICKNPNRALAKWSDKLFVSKKFQVIFWSNKLIFTTNYPLGGKADLNTWYDWQNHNKNDKNYSG